MRSLETHHVDSMLKRRGKGRFHVVSTWNPRYVFVGMYLQKCEEHFGGDLIGCGEDGNVYKGLVCFMIAGLKESVPYVIKSSPQTGISGDWLKNELLECLDVLIKSGFNTRVTICDNHPSNVSAFKKLLECSNQDHGSLFMLNELSKVYLSYDTFHLIKNVQNNLLNHKRLLFPSFTFNGFKDSINVTGGELKWKMLHDVFERDAQLDGNLKKAPKVTLKVLQPGSNKQNVPLALAMFDETTSAAIQWYFPQHSSAAEFLQLFQKWWIISNSKSQFSATNYLGNAALLGDEKPLFLRAFASWLRDWQQERISNCQRFTLTSQTASGFTRTLLCHASLIEDLLEEGYEVVLTSRF